MVKEVTGGYKIKYHPEGPDGPAWDIDFTPPFRRLDIINDLEKILEIKFPPTEEFESKSTQSFLDKLCVERGVDCSAPRTTARLLDKVRIGSYTMQIGRW